MLFNIDKDTDDTVVFASYVTDLRERERRALIKLL